mmetsp:Transcript_34205/g.68101  ORF Transcript_34205/g.68101 Transcript_34205/m.68101 type:complete len:165 (-) Transcript_34205:116-610(-)
MRVEACYQAQTVGDRRCRWYPGTIAAEADPEGRFDVQYDDGDFEAHVPSHFLRRLLETPQDPISQDPLPAMEPEARELVSRGAPIPRDPVSGDTVQRDAISRPALPRDPSPSRAVAATSTLRGGAGGGASEVEEAREKSRGESGGEDIEERVGESGGHARGGEG